ncbi:type III-A CRISPR-associated RAMP protein Csm4 [Alicyclobacillaceae bacterium I2511]|nr:type III-A CRISPR-associated RAMP protein Csm4 [Alicyclobacillaceae bacterium I2511]
MPTASLLSTFERADGRVDYVVEMNFQSPVHVGEPGIGEEATTQILRSDTWFSAITVAIRQLYGDATVQRWVNELAQAGAETLPQEAVELQAFEGIPGPFRVSSAFPVLKKNLNTGGDEPLYFLPKPMLPPPGFEGDPLIRAKWAKAVKKVRFVPISLFHQWITATDFSEEDYESLNLSRTKDLLSVGNETLIPRVSLDRETSASEYFRQGLRVYGEGSGLFFILQVTPEWQKTVETSLRWLGESGIGGKRSIGYGRFSTQWHLLQEESEVKMGELGQSGTRHGTRALTELWQLLHPSFQADGYISLSLYHPAGAETLHDWRGASVQWVDRRGWSAYGDDGQQVKRRSVRMFAEGSWFPWRPEGHMVDVTPEIWRGRRTLFRNGLCLSVPALRGGKGVAGK